LNFDLRRQPAFSALEPRLRMRGMYRYLADAGRFRECLTERDMPVAQTGANRALERAYGNAAANPGEPLLVSIEGRLVPRPKIERRGRESAVVVEKFIEVMPGESCSASPAAR